MRQAPLVIAEKLIRGPIVQNRQLRHAFLDFSDHFVETGVTLTEGQTLTQRVQDRVLDALAGVGRKLLGQADGFLVFDG